MSLKYLAPSDYIIPNMFTFSIGIYAKSAKSYKKV